ncbi:C4-dicarboxylate TRAP transporter substrate-binding protein [Saccharomonospora azurea]|uniref:C4-dicarboxylate TRAP transporter substrate-binding protein n=1 Tax=Saccharomonospora azurea TaxID=40988 RepID=UPI00023FEE3B|nr:C4-dicarboxylate TRAP transporter substrate-binding protein [Saccharomonospora azurea]EHK82477.1 extracellular solute-binding protein [Saccharomonospora azurea SZMC 14600]
MFRSRKSTLVACLAGLALVLSGCGGIASSGEGRSVELKAASLLPPNGSQSDMIQWFMDELEKRTGGEVETEVVHGGALLSGTDVLPGMKQGRAEAGQIVPAYFPAELPLNNVNMVPMAGADQAARLLAFQDLADGNDDFAAEFERNGLHLIGYLPNASSTVAFNREVTSLDDVRGAKLRIPSQPQSVVWEELGAEPVFMASEEVYEAVERNIVDGVTFPMDTQVANGITEVAKYMAPDIGQNGGAIFAISQTVYDRLSDDVKAVIDELKGEWYAKTAELLTEYEQQACEKFTAAGGTVVLWDDDEQKTIASATEKLATDVWQTEAAKSVDRSAVEQVWSDYTAAVEQHTGEAGYTDGLQTCGK